MVRSVPERLNHRHGHFVFHLDIIVGVVTRVDILHISDSTVWYSVWDAICLLQRWIRVGKTAQHFVMRCGNF